MNGLRYARGYGVSTCYQFDIYRSEFTSMFNGVLMFDVLEHLEDDVAALRSACRMLKPGGKITLTVPAHMLLWSRVDFLSGHKRRYNLQTIEAVLGAAGFNVISSRYFFRFLVPIMFFGRLFKHDSGCPATESELEALQLEAAPASLNVLVRQVLRADSRWLGFLDKCFGSSIIVTAIKKPA
jgi:SAM-dependent methyltransferase